MTDELHRLVLLAGTTALAAAVVSLGVLVVGWWAVLAAAAGLVLWPLMGATVERDTPAEDLPEPEGLSRLSIRMRERGL